MRGCLPAVLVLCLLADCGGAQHAAPPAGQESRFICQAECRRDRRCGEMEADCFQRCASLPVESPPVWRGDWAHEVASCIDGTACGHDLDEGCVFSSTGHTKAAPACFAAGGGFARCAVLNGLTPSADAKATACFDKGGDGCTPDMEWK
jgi:hypothetical protein